MNNFPTPQHNSRIGFHYFPDTLHYRESDLNTWLPELLSLGASWLTLTAPVERAIPEPFLRGLQAANIEPILHFDLPLIRTSANESFQLLLKSYASWDVHYIALFDRPNLRHAWPASGWAQSDLVERFMDIFIPYAQAVVDLGMIPVFPPLEPGGDYWDTAFLRAALRSLLRRKQQKIIDRLAIGAYAWADNQLLNWGAGGPERWPSARPYFSSASVQDQRGYRIFDWYTTLIQSELGETRPILLLAAGSRPGDKINPARPAVDGEEHLRQNLGIVRMIFGDPPEQPAPAFMSDSIPHNLQASQTSSEAYEEIPEEVLASNFWLLSASPESAYLAHAWFQPDGSHLPVVTAIRKYLTARHKSYTSSLAYQTVAKSCNGECSAKDETSAPAKRIIEHYLLLPVFEGGVAEWQLEVIKGFVKKHHPTIGFSTREAALAKKVTMIGGLQNFDETVENGLRAAGCEVIRISGNGISIASQLASQ